MSKKYGEKFNSYYETISKFPISTDTEIMELFIMYKEGDLEAAEKIINNYLKLVVDIVLKLGRSIDKNNIMDVIQYGNGVLAKAIYNYNFPEINFNNFIVGEIRSKVITYLKKQKEYEQLEDLEIQEFVFDKEMYLVLREVMGEKLYCCFYSIIAGKNFKEVANSFGVDEENVINLYRRACRVFNIYKDKNSDQYKKVLDQIKSREGRKIELLKEEPILISNIIQFIYIKQFLNQDEINLFYYRVFSRYNYSVGLSKVLKISNFRYVEINKSLKRKIETHISSEEYREFYDAMIFKYGTSVYEFMDDVNLKKVNYEEIKKYVETLTLDDIRKMLGDNVTLLNADELTLLSNFFGNIEETNVDSEAIEREINLVKYGFNRKSHVLQPGKLYDTFLRYREEFNDEQALFLECYYFRIKDKNLFNKKFPDSVLRYKYYYLINRLERLYYGIFRILENNFNREKYLFVKENYYDRLPEKKFEMLDLFFGVNGKRYTIQEIAGIYKMDYIKAHDYISDGRDSCMRLYASRGNRLELDKKLYIPYLDDIYEYTDETRKILKMYLVDNLTYDDISEKTGLSKYRISNIITDGIRKIDNYRFGLVTPYVVTEEELEEFLKYYHKLFDETERDILRDKFIRKIENKKIAEARNMLSGDVNKLFTKFYKLHLKFKVLNVECNVEDVIKEIERHVSESILSLQEKEVLSLSYGIKNQYNKDGMVCDLDTIALKLGITGNVVRHRYYDAIDKIKARKIKFREPDLCFIDREELDKLLDDPHLPISEKERNIICYIFELKGYPCKTINEVAPIIGDGLGSVRRRYFRSIITIKRYLAGEIEGQINYELDIVPLLKYFSTGDRVFIEEYYKNNLTYEQMSFKYKLTIDRVIGIMDRIKFTFFDLQNDPNAKKFDFDYYKEAIKDDKLPFYGSLDKAAKIFNLFFAMDGIQRCSALEIIKRLNLDNKTTSVNNCVNNLLLSVCKLRDGMFKEQVFTYDEIKDYYDRNKDKMKSVHRVYYDRYFARMKNNELNGSQSKVSSYITYDLLKERCNDLFKLEDADRSFVINILRDRLFPLSSETRKALMFYFNIRKRDLMKGKDINHLYRLVHSLFKQGILTFNEDVCMKKSKKD